MLYVVDKATKAILWKCDAWDYKCFEKAKAFIVDEQLGYVSREVTFSGDMVVWVKELA